MSNSSGSTITGTISTTVTLGAGGYPSPLTVSTSGVVKPIVYGATAVYSDMGNASLINHGTLLGAYAGLYQGNGGDAVDFIALGTITNTGDIFAGSGGDGDGYGGTGVSLSSGKLTNSGTIGGGGARYEGSGGAGVFLGSGTLVDTGTITGGNGGKYDQHYVGGAGGAGVSLGAGTISSSGTIEGALRGFPLTASQP